MVETEIMIVVGYYRKSRLKVYTTTESVMRPVTTQLDLTIEQLNCGVTANKTSILLADMCPRTFPRLDNFRSTHHKGWRD